MAERTSNRPDVWRDVLTLPEARIPRDRLVIVRAQAMLTAIAPVLAGNACLTRPGAHYLGIEWHARTVGGLWWE